MNQDIFIKGAKEHNLKNISVKIPKGKMTVITGVSGSGKSSLAFDTLYAEGYRKYIESLSARARMILEQVPRPNVEYIDNLSPVIAIEQRISGGASPRSTVATVTEIAEYAKLIYPICAESFCPKCGGKIEQHSFQECIDEILNLPKNAKFMILSLLATGDDKSIKEEILSARQRGFSRFKIDDKFINLDDQELILTPFKNKSAYIIIDRLTVNEKFHSRIADSLELAFKQAQNKALILWQDENKKNAEKSWNEKFVSNELTCQNCSEKFSPLTHGHFSFNNHEGACSVCEGVGQITQFLPELIIDEDKSIKNGAIKAWRIGGMNLIMYRNALLKQLAPQLPYDPNTPWKDLPKKTQDEILYGAGDRIFSFKLRRAKKPKLVKFEGVLAELNERFRDNLGETTRTRYAKFQSIANCPACKGSRFSPRTLNAKIEGINIADFFAFNVKEAVSFVRKISKLAKYKKANEAILNLLKRLEFLEEVGLEYLNLNRLYGSLSGGEVQRVKIASQLGMALTGVTYILDEPSIGLHPSDHEKLIKNLKSLKNHGNTVVIVEHDDQTMKMADYIIEIGKEAGENGGNVVFEGTIKECLKDKHSRTGLYLNEKLKITKNVPSIKPDKKFITIKGAKHNNLKNITAKIPVGLLTVVCGKSGSGKSSLINEILAKTALRKLNKAKCVSGKVSKIEGLEHFNRCVVVDQKPIGLSPRSNPATFIKLFDYIRKLYASLPLSQMRGYKEGRFSFNTKGGRCEICSGDGVIKLDMQFLDDVFIQCPSCKGKRYNRQTLEVLFKDKNISDVLNMSVNEAIKHFENQPKIMQKLNTLSAVGLGYIRLGQPAPSLSGGEAQRIKLALELSAKEQGKTLYILDEPTTGLHWDDIQKLMDLLFKLRQAGNTIIIIEHHPDVIKNADFLIELGPVGGTQGGNIIYQGEPFNIKNTPTAPFVK